MTPDDVVKMLALLTNRPNLTFQVTRTDSIWRAAAIGYGEGQGATVDEACSDFAQKVLSSYANGLDTAASDLAVRQSAYTQAQAVASVAGVAVSLPKVQ